VWIRVLGSAAGGGFPQWNCACRNCTGVRAGTLPARTRTQASIAVSTDREHWFLVNAGPDVASQLNALAETPIVGRPSPRRAPVAAVLLTDAELDHVAGLLSLREGSGLVVYATAWVHRAAAPILDVLSSYVPVDRREMPTDGELTLAPGLSVRALPTGSGKRPRYATEMAADSTAVVGYRFTEASADPHTGTDTGDGGRSLVYAPCVPDLHSELLAELAGADCVLLDGTCWSDDEMATVGLPGKTSRAMGHAPVSGPGGTLERLAALKGTRRIYTHLNNTNPLVVEDSAQRRAVEAAGVEVAHDGMEITL
jgi:pyrroloquinoline quinone biosynthesis protein B